MPVDLAYLDSFYRKDETECLHTLLNTLQGCDLGLDVEERAKRLVVEIREQRLKKGGVNALMAEYDLSNQEGVALMCLAEALLRIPDPLTKDRLIRDKIGSAHWKKHLGESESLFVNAATYGLQLASKIVKQDDFNPRRLNGALAEFFKKNSIAAVRRVVEYAIRILGNHFVIGETITQAEDRSAKGVARGYRYSFDMLGEAVRTEKDALLFLDEYKKAIHRIGKIEQKTESLYAKAGISIKLSALHPRYEFQNPDRMHQELYPRVKELCLLAKEYNISLTIDAEEADRLIPSLQILEGLAQESELQSWQGLGLAVQAYQKRAFYVIDYLKTLAQKTQRRLMVRLVKGAYWDSEIKLAQEQGVEGYPVFTRKVYTDVSYLACAKKMLEAPDCFYAMFATHNAFTVAAVFKMAGKYRDYEFQCLYGMGDGLYDQIVDPVSEIAMPCRVYAPVGTHERLLAYLMRRLLENGANSSFVNQILNKAIPVADLVRNPIDEAHLLELKPHPNIPLPCNIYGEKRMNAKGLDLSNSHTLIQITNQIHEACQDACLALPMLSEQMEFSHVKHALHNPAQTSEVIGHVIEAGPNDVELALEGAAKAFPRWSHTSVAERVAMLKRMADLLEANMPRFMALAIKEAGKSIPNAIGEVREAIDFCRYYAQEAERLFSKPTVLKGITGEHNSLSWHGRGIMVCISPWNFPLAIFLGEVTAALAAGNVVIAKPAEQTPLIATLAVELLHQAGFPRDVVQMLPGSGEVVGAKLVADPRIAGVVFTGSTETAHLINETLSKKKGPIATLIAETGGQNAMIVDSSALPEQVVKDVIASSFDSAGQRCSALRVLYVQQDIADVVIEMLKGAMAELKVGNPLLLSTDIGPVIDQQAQEQLQAHIEAMRAEAKILYQTPIAADIAELGHFVAPTLIEIPHIRVLKREVFGPILHVVRFHASQLDDVIEQINSTGYGLTFGVHSRIDSFIDYVKTRIQAGNLYVNRNMIGAVVGVQPFGGEGLSGTGPKAGGPAYLPRLALERVVSVNTTASGGNASLMTLGK